MLPLYAPSRKAIHDIQRGASPATPTTRKDEKETAQLEAFNAAHKSKPLLANAKQLQDVRHSVAEEIPLELLPDPTQSEEELLNKQRKDPNSSHLLSEQLKLMNAQRIEQITSFIEVLHHRVVKKKNCLKTFIELWNASQILVESTQTLASPLNSTTTKGKSSNLATKLRWNALKDAPQIPRQEIIQQTQKIQQLLWKKKQSELQPSVKIQQLEQHIQLIRKGMLDKQVMFENDLVKEMMERLLLQIDSLLNGLQLVDNDANRMTAKILLQLTATAAAEKLR